MTRIRTDAALAPHAGSDADLRTLRHALAAADDDKVRRITAVVDGIADPAVNLAVLEPLRGRLGPLRPPRQLRLPRLLFLPLDPVIVPAKAWRPDEPLVPRSAITPVTALIRAELGPEAAAIESRIAGRNTDDIDVVAEAGRLLWPRAADIAVSVAAPPGSWAACGIPEGGFRALMCGMASVWRRAARLRVLARDRLLDAMKADEAVVQELLAGTPAESQLGCALVARLILLQAPSAAPFVRLFANASTNHADRATLHRALVQGITYAASNLKPNGLLLEGIGKASLADAGDVARGLVSLLAQLEQDEGNHVPPPQVHAMRDGLAKACLSRFASSLAEGVTTPLQQASAPLAAADQEALEEASRALRMLEGAARPLGGGSAYDDLLNAATRVVHDGRARGTLSRMGEIRLTEILAGPEAALCLYRTHPT